MLRRIGHSSNPDFLMILGLVGHLRFVGLSEDVEDDVGLEGLAILVPVQLLANLDLVIQLYFHRFR